MAITQPSWKTLTQNQPYRHLKHLHIILQFDRKPLQINSRAAMAILLQFLAVFWCFFKLGFQFYFFENRHRSTASSVTDDSGA